MKLALIILIGFAVYNFANASVANLLADRALKKLTDWIDSRGSDWLSLPGCYKKGQLQSSDEEFTLAFAGPQLDKIGTVVRSGEAELTDEDPDQSYETSQTLKFVVMFRNITIRYEHMSCTSDVDGFVNLTSQATSDGVSATVKLNLKGQGDSCLAFTDTMDVNFNGSLWVTVAKSTSNCVATVVETVKSHFKSNVPKAIETLLKTATFDSLEYYDICTGVNYPQVPPNVLADSLLNVTSHLLEENISEWATLPAFSKTSLVNNTNLDIIKVGRGIFRSFGHIRRVGPAVYKNQVNPKLIDLELSFEVSNLTAFYGHIEYVDYTIWFPIAELVTGPKIGATLTVTFVRKTPDSAPSCVDGRVAVKSKYLKSGGNPHLANLTPHVPNYAMRSVDEVLTTGFRETVEKAANSLFKNAAIHALKEICK